ncbi:dTDP-4-dehydrorhamnose 3,5-epimerase [Hyphomicrobium denitrificans 1NES1]|uniref:dTDP-4-dehydrorhamnose 3,5-epimerase n=1 Tax=Hyphomicrobium denitrificans 1NES1 TaxID=670307 RepID=N0BAQ7_9HYPH|nr:dTDP-4-dehydrorhamnose 3,5-epimerase family protein [Hyphomicrobium denitrificans]AGK57596.1 dTDP-4-dehydrorhamnose 3,5-epimerase [Hyphomicrobium denitrificans 1NES1]
MKFIETQLKGAFLIELEKHIDERGFFARTFCQDEFAEHGLKPIIAQSNIAHNIRKGTIRGMHFQYPPAAETKLVSCTRGAIVDTIVDLRPESKTYLQHFSVELTADNMRALYVPERFAHGYQTLQDNTDTTYQMGAMYSPSLQAGIKYDDPRLGLVWPLEPSVISDKDQAYRRFDEIETELIKRMSHNAG